ncbi:SIR2 family protein [Clostridium sp. UBA7503]|uniref:SIR2 family protein n=1 Tax=Clostridium sp. UBA7503 TaxID=1946377 RepID=UPI0032180484
MTSKDEYYISSSVILASEEDTQFFRNDQILKNSETTADISLSEFRSFIKQEVSGFIHRSFDNIIILAGAGASVVSTEESIDKDFGKTVFMLAQDIKSELDSDTSLFSLEDLAKESKYDVSVEIDSDGEKKVFNPDFNLEDFLSNLITFEKYVPDAIKEKYQKSKNKIFQLIRNNTSYDFNKEKLKHAAFINTLAKKVKSPSKLTIVTTNYDTIFEDAAESIGFTVMDGFSFSHKPYFDSNMFEWNLVKDIENVKTKELEYKKNILSLLKIHGSLTWERDELGIRRKDKSTIVTPIMIFPSSNKYMQSYQEPYFELFTKFQELLKRPNTLLITTGFSFLDTHISKMITQAITHNKGLSTLVSDFNIKQNTKNWNELLTLMEQNYQIAFLKATMNSNLTEYLGE